MEQHQFGLREWADLCERKDATIAALQARVQELEAQHEDLVERNRILRHRPDLPVERTEFHDRFVKLQSQLTQRTAELEAAKRERDKIVEARQNMLQSMANWLAQLKPTHHPLYRKGVEEVIAAAFNGYRADKSQPVLLSEWQEQQIRLANPQAELERVRAALERIARYGKDGICPFGCDTPHIAQAALTATSQPQPPYKEWCRHPDKCAGLASCPQDPTCAD